MQFKSKAQVHDKKVLSNEMNSFLQCQKTEFHVFELFAEKVILELKCTKITSLELLRTPILCFKSKPKCMKKILMKLTVFCNAEDRFSCV